MLLCISVYWDINNGVIFVVVRFRGGVVIVWDGIDGALLVYYGLLGIDMYICSRWVDSLFV